MASEGASTLTASLRGPTVALAVRPLHDYLAASAATFPDRPWLSEGSAVLSYAEGLARVEDWACLLAAHGIEPGDRVAVLMPNSIAFALIAFACWRQGFILVGLNPLYSDATLGQLVADARPRVIVTQEADGLIERATTISTPLAISVLSSSPVAGNSGSEQGDSLPPCSEPGLSVLQYTGGTTGVPKGAMLSHRNVSACVEQILLDMRDFRPGQESFIALGPFSHVIGTTLTLALATAVGAEIVIPERFEPEATTRFLLERKISVIFAVPTIFGAIAHSAAGRDGDWLHLRYALCGGAPLPAAIKADFERLSGTLLHQGYGSSETASGAVFTPAAGLHPAGSVGRPMANCTVEIVDPQGRPVADGAQGEIVISGPNVMEGYWAGEAPSEMRATDVPGRFATGDSGCIRGGALFVVDRIKDMIIASGFNIYPAQVEAVLRDHPAIAEVAVVGAPDAYRGETVKAVIVSRPGRSLTIEDLQDYSKGRLSALEMPRLLEIVDALPRTAIGKIDKRKLR